MARGIPTGLICRELPRGGQRGIHHAAWGVIQLDEPAPVDRRRQGTRPAGQNGMPVNRAAATAGRDHKCQEVSRCAASAPAQFALIIASCRRLLVYVDALPRHRANRQDNIATETVPTVNSGQSDVVYGQRCRSRSRAPLTR